MKKSFSNILTVGLITFAFFIPQLLKGRIPIPADSILTLYHPFRDIELDGFNKGKFPAKNPFINDPVLQTYEWKYQVIKNIKKGSLPLWNPYSFSGQPLLANFQSATFGILNVMFLVLPFKFGWAISVIIPPFLLSIFMYFLLKELKISKEASIFGAVVVPFTGFFMPWLTLGTIVTTAMWLPLILLSILKLQSKISSTWFLILTISSTFTIFSGHAQTALYVFSAALLFIIFQFISNHNIKAAAVTIGSLLLGILMSSVQTIPFIEFIKLSARATDQGYFNGRQDWFLPFQNLMQLIAPDFFGNPTTNNYWGVWNYWEFVSFIGIIPLAFAIYAIFKKSTNRFFIILAAISLLLSLPNPISKIPYTLNLPFISSMQPSRIIFLFVFSLVSLSAYGFDYFLKEKKIKFVLVSVSLLAAILLVAFYSHNLDSSTKTIAQRNLILPIGTVLILLFISIVRSKSSNTKVIIALVYLVTLMELFRFAYKFTPFSKPSWIFPQTQITEFLQKQQRPFRIMTTDRRVMHPNISSAYNIESVDGYDPIYLERYAKLVSVWQSNNPSSKISSFNRIVTPQEINSPVINLLNVKYVLSLDEINNQDFVKILEEGETKLYQNTKVLPRVFFASEVKKVRNDEEELAQLTNKNLDAKIATSQTFEADKEQRNTSANIKSYDDQKIVISTTSDKAAPLILTNPYYPGWNVYVDGKRDEVQKADFMFQSAVVPQGNHTVEFKFEPKSFYNGLILSTVGIVATALIATIIWKKKYQ